MKIIKEIVLSKLDQENPPVIRAFDDDTTYLLFEEFPPENVDESYFADFEDKLTEILQTKVIREDRERFFINTNSLDTLKKLQDYLEKLYNLELE